MRRLYVLDTPDALRAAVELVLEQKDEHGLRVVWHFHALENMIRSLFGEAPGRDTLRNAIESAPDKFEIVSLSRTNYGVTLRTLPERSNHHASLWPDRPRRGSYSRVAGKEGLVAGDARRPRKAKRQDHSPR